MRSRPSVLVLPVIFLALGTTTSPQQVSAPSHSTPTVVQATLAPGSVPFHIKAVITEGRNTEPIGHVEMYWVAPNKWRRTIESDDFSQTLVVNGHNARE